MRFSKNNQPNNRQGGRKPDPNSKAGQKRAEQAKAERAKAEEAFNAFQNAESGFFDGFEFCEIFHARINKCDAVEVLESDDIAQATTSAGATIHAGADGVTVYVMTESARTNGARKLVCFNRSVYAF